MTMIVFMIVKLLGFVVLKRKIRRPSNQDN